MTQRQEKERQVQIPLVLALVTCLFWLIALRYEITYGGFENTDSVIHESFVQHFLEAFQRGSLGIDDWYDKSSLGLATFRTYHHLAHILIAITSLITGIENNTLLIHLFAGLAFCFQSLAFYFAARLVSFSPIAAVLSAWLAPLIVGRHTLLGINLETYTSTGYGTFTQAIAIPTFVLGVAYTIRSMRLGKRSENFNSTIRIAIITAWYISLTFLIHIFFGYMNLLVISFLFLVALTIRKISLKFLLQYSLVFGTVFGLIAGYQIISILQDAPLTHQTITDNGDRWVGMGISKTLLTLVRGDFFDFKRWPFFSVLILLGGASCIKASYRRKIIPFLFIGLLSLILLSGKKSFGIVLNVVPGMEHMAFDRFSGLLQVTGVFIAASGAEFLLKARIFTLNRYTRAVSVITLISIVGFMINDRLSYVKHNDTKVLARIDKSHSFQEAWLAQIEDPQLGRLWAQYSFDKKQPKFGTISYTNIAARHNIPQISLGTTVTTHTFDALHLFWYRNLDHFNIFNVTRAILPKDQPPPPFMKPLGEFENIRYYQILTRGPFDIIQIPHREVVPERAYFPVLEKWMYSDQPNLNWHPAIVPRPIIDRWPEAFVPKDSHPKLQSLGSVLNWTKVAHHYKATFYSISDNAYGLFRMAYHPRWKIQSKNRWLPSYWVLPGYIAFPLNQGLNEISLSFSEDPLRHLQFLVGLSLLIILPLWLLTQKRIAPS